MNGAAVRLGIRSGPAGRGAPVLVVTGVHREELGFGDRVASLLDRGEMDVLRIPQGLPHGRAGRGEEFYHRTRHREMYLQLRQQLGNRYALIIDLHSGLDDTGRCADVFCADERFLQCLAARLEPDDDVRLVRIVAEAEAATAGLEASTAQTGAHTVIPRELWDDPACLYVGVEIYLDREGDGGPGDWRYARDLIRTISRCRPTT